MPGPQGEAASAERLALAKQSFAQAESHASDLEAKARTYLTVNSMLLTAGVLYLANGARAAPLSIFWGAASTVAVIGLLALVACAFHSLFNVLSVRRFEGHPRASTTLNEFAGSGVVALRDALAAYYASATERNHEVNRDMVRSLKAGVWRTQLSFWFFALSVASLTVLNFYLSSK